MIKVYTHMGLKFRIYPVPQPAVEGVPYFTPDEWSWIKEQQLDHNMFKVLVLARCDDMRAPIIPENVIATGQALAKTYAPMIINQLRAGGAVRREERDGR